MWWSSQSRLLPSTAFILSRGGSGVKKLPVVALRHT